MADLIDRAAAIEEMRRFKEIMGTNRCNAGWYDAVSIVKDLPAVDAAPVVHARWKSVKASASNNYPFWDSKCSECGYITAMTQTGWLYCPHCGAKMDGERRESE